MFPSPQTHRRDRAVFLAGFQFIRGRTAVLLRAKGAEGQGPFSPGLRGELHLPALPGLGVAEVRVPDGPLCPSWPGRQCASGQWPSSQGTGRSGASFLGKGRLRPAHPLTAAAQSSSLTPHACGGCAGGFRKLLAGVTPSPPGLWGPRCGTRDRKHPVTLRPRAFPTVLCGWNGYEEPPMGPL